MTLGFPKLLTYVTLWRQNSAAKFTVLVLRNIKVPGLLCTFFSFSPEKNHSRCFDFDIFTWNEKPKQVFWLLKSENFYINHLIKNYDGWQEEEWKYWWEEKRGDRRVSQNCWQQNTTQGTGSSTQKTKEKGLFIFKLPYWISHLLQNLSLDRHDVMSDLWILKS